MATLAGMSADYYARLEQQRGPQPSEQVLGALSGVLRLSEGEREYLFNIAGRTAPACAPTVAEQPGPALLRALDLLGAVPAAILSDVGDDLGKNDLARALYGDTSHHTGLARSEIYRWFTDPARQLLCPEQERENQSRCRVARLRAAYGSAGPRSRAGELVRALREGSTEFARLWDLHEVARQSEGRVTVLHPRLGEIELERHVLFADDKNQVLLVFYPAPGSDAERKIRLLDERPRSAS